MDKKESKYITVSYQLYSIDQDGKKHLEEQTQQGQPFHFVSGFGFSLDAFEERIVDLPQGSKFDFTLSPADAFGEYDPDGVQKVPREEFSINGHFDHENIFPGAFITVQMKGDEDDGRRYHARVTEVGEDEVTIDMNHPLAGMTLQFIGLVLENRDATKDEIQNIINQLSHECCGCEDCEGEEGHEGGCGCGHCHH